MDDDEKLKQVAEEFARANRRCIAKDYTNSAIFVPDEVPISIFMAGSPGAGKTEYSRNLITLIEIEMKHRVIRIDADDLRSYLPGYTGKNSYLFQTAVSIIVERIHDLVLDNGQSFLLDGTLSKHEKAAHNINRSLNRSRPVRIFYMYQKPEVAWRFTQAREKVEGRRIPKDIFIQQFIDSRNTIERIRKNFDDRVIIFLVKKDFETNAVEKIVQIKQGGHQIGHYVEMRYNTNDLEKLL